MVMKHVEEPAKKHVDEPAPAPASKLVKVKCIVRTFPWTDQKGLAFDEEAEVSEEVAKIMEDAKQVERVK